MGLKSYIVKNAKRARSRKAVAAVAVAAAVASTWLAAAGASAQLASPEPRPVPSASATAQPSEEQTVTIPRGVPVPILVTRDVRAGANGMVQEEHKVKFAVDQDVIVDGYVIAKAGDLAEGHYDTSTNQTKRQFETETSQELELDVDDIVNFCGDTIYVQFERTFVGGTRSGFLSFGVHERDAVFAKGAVLEAATDRVQKLICAEPANGPAPALPKNVITPDATLTPPP